MYWEHKKSPYMTYLPFSGDNTTDKKPQWTWVRDCWSWGTQYTSDTQRSKETSDWCFSYMNFPWITGPLVWCISFFVNREDILCRAKGATKYMLFRSGPVFCSCPGDVIAFFCVIVSVKWSLFSFFLIPLCNAIMIICVGFLLSSIAKYALNGTFSKRQTSFSIPQPRLVLKIAMYRQFILVNHGVTSWFSNNCGRAT